MKRSIIAVFSSLLFLFLSVGATAVPAHEHVAGETRITVIAEPTCAAEGSYQETTLCAVCGEEMDTVTVTVPKTLNHVPSPSVKENTVPATCAMEGTYDSVIYCAVCGEEIQRVIGIIPRMMYHISEYSQKRTVSRDEDGRTIVTFDDPAYDPLVKNETLPEALDGATVEAGCYLLGDGSQRSCADGEERCAVCGTLLNPAIPHIWDKGSWSAPCEEYPWSSIYSYQCLLCGNTKSADRYAGKYYPYGDVNGDYAVTAEDARLALRASVRLEEYDPASRAFYCADCDGDGKISASDAREILLTSVNLRYMRWVGHKYVIYRKGDVDFDGMVTSTDARLVLRYSVGLGDFDKIISSNLNSDSYRAADFDMDAKITPADARMILRIAVGLPN